LRTIEMPETPTESWQRNGSSPENDDDEGGDVSMSLCMNGGINVCSFEPGSRGLTNHESDITNEARKKKE